MPQITITPSACTAGAGWQDLRYFANNSGLRQLVFTLPNNATLGGGGVNITGITLRGYVRNSASAVKRLLYGCKTSTGQAPGAWAQVNGASVNDYAFTAASSSNGSYKYFNVVRALSGVPLERFVAHMRAQFAAGEPVYLGVIQPDASRSIQVEPSLGYWTVTVTYELLGNVPVANVQTAVLGSTAITTTLNKVVEGSSTTIRYKLGETLLSEADIGTGASHTYTVPTSAGQYFPTAQTAQMTIEAETYVGGESYGTVSTAVTLTLPEDAAPTVTCTPSPAWTAGTTAAQQLAAYVQGAGGVQFALSGGAGKYGATVAGIRVGIEGKTYTLSAASGTVTHSPIAGSGSLAWTCAVTDSRGLTRTYTGTLTVLAWSAPKITAFAVARATEAGAQQVDGTCALVSVQASVSSLPVDGTQKNALKWRVQYRQITEDMPEDWTGASVSDTVAQGVTSVNLSALLESNGETIDTFSDLQGYQFRLIVEDIYAQTTALAEMQTKAVYLEVDTQCGSMGFGGAADAESETPKYDFYGEMRLHEGAVGQLVYTSAETDTGLRWIDGKPVYCKTFRGSQANDGNANAQIIGYLDDHAEVVRFDGYVQRSDSGTIMPLTYAYFNNMQQMISVFVNSSGGVGIQKGDAWQCRIYVVSVLYTKTTDTPEHYYLPFLFSANEQGCALTASSEYSASYPVENAFNGRTNNYWACTANDSERWVQVQLPYALRNIVVTLVSPQGGATAAQMPAAGQFIDGTSGAVLSEFSGRPTDAGSETVHALGNDAGCDCLRVKVTSPAAGTWTGFGDIRIEGEVVA